MSYDCKDDRTFVLTNGSNNKKHSHKENPAGTKERLKLEGDEIVSPEKMKKLDGVRLQQLRMQKGLSQVDFAKCFNINKSVIQQYEDGTVVDFKKATYNAFIRKLESMPDKKKE
jgi:DNA-binding transcriptional regulator YiaG